MDYVVQNPKIAEVRRAWPAIAADAAQPAHSRKLAYHNS